MSRNKTKEDKTKEDKTKEDKSYDKEVYAVMWVSSSGKLQWSVHTSKELLENYKEDVVAFGSRVRPVSMCTFKVPDGVYQVVAAVESFAYAEALTISEDEAVLLDVPELLSWLVSRKNITCSEQEEYYLL